jgi:hypothetical protein
MSDKKEHNYVADAQNWEQRIKGEINAARVCNIWSLPIRYSIYCPLWQMKRPSFFFSSVALYCRYGQKIGVSCTLLESLLLIRGK